MSCFDLLQPIDFPLQLLALQLSKAIFLICNQQQNSNIIKRKPMGCQAVSVYHDEANGAIGYPEQIQTDLYNRNYCSGNLLKNVMKTHPYYIHGFNQSFAEAKLFTYVLNNLEYFIYAAGRFLMIVQINTKDQRAIMHQDKIILLDCKGKLCLTATVGGRLILWDLQFFQQKVNLKMPQSILTLSSISFTQKYIFCTDTANPNSSIFCYDIRTTKLRAKSQIVSYESIYRGANWGTSRHVTVAADGVWFFKFDEKSSTIQAVKGMFRIFPKTSMTSLHVVDQTYLITGSIDGYVFLWAHDQCQKAMKVGDFGISELFLLKNKLIVSNFADNVRVFQYTIKKKKNMEQSQKNNGEITQQFVSVIIDSYQRQPLQAIAISKLDQSIYYAQTRNGLLYNKMIPSAEYHKKLGFYKQMDKKIIEFERQTLKYIYKDQLWLVRHNRQFFQLKRIQLSENAQNWKVNNRYLSNAKKYLDIQDRPLYCFIPKINKMCYVGKDKIYLCQIADIEANLQFKLSSLQQTETVILNYQSEGTNALIIRGFVSFQIGQSIYLMIFFDQQYLLLRQEKEGGKWTKANGQQYQKQVIKQVTVQGQKIEFEHRNNTYRVIDPKINSQMKEKMSFMHCIHEIEDLNNISGSRILSLGGSIAIIK